MSLPEVNLTQVAFEKIRNAIVCGQFDLAEPLSENELAKALGMSKAPIRSAMNELRLKGLVDIIPQSGSYVFSPTRVEIEQLCDFRSLLELQALTTAMQSDPTGLLSSLATTVAGMKEAFNDGEWRSSKRLDTEFHTAIIRHSHNKYLIQTYETISPTVEALRYRFMDTVMYRNKAFEEHEKIMRLLEIGKTSKVLDILRDHISRTKFFQAGVNWPRGRSQRKDYRFRDYSQIFRDADAGALAAVGLTAIAAAQS